MEGTSRDPLELERKNSAIGSALLVCKNKKSSSLSGSSLPDLKPVIAPLPKSQVLDKVKGFLGIMAEANKRLELEAKDNLEAVDIEALTGNEYEVIEMDLMLGVVDLHTPEAVNAVEAAIIGNQPVIPLAGGSSDFESEKSDHESDSDQENKPGVKNNSSCESIRKGRSSKRPKIIEIS